MHFVSTVTGILLKFIDIDREFREILTTYSTRQTEDEWHETLLDIVDYSTTLPLWAKEILKSGTTAMVETWEQPVEGRVGRKEEFWSEARKSFWRIFELYAKHIQTEMAVERARIGRELGMESEELDWGELQV